MKKAWIRHCIELAKQPADLYSGCRKILRDVQLEFPAKCTLTLQDVGFTTAKMRQLERNYVHQESITASSGLWDEYRTKPKYRSVAISCFQTLVKDHNPGGNTRGSKMGSCLMAISLTMLKRQEVAVSLHYRTTEILKKFPADLVMVTERILPQFNLEGMKVVEFKAKFDNLTVHPQYFSTIIPHLPDPLQTFEDLRDADPYFHRWCCRWTGRYLIPGYTRGIEKFAQAMRVKMDAEKRIPEAVRLQLIPYLIQWGQPERTRFDLPK